MLKQAYSALATWWKQFRCKHSSGWVVLSISYDGITTAECPGCGKRITIPRHG